MQANHVRSGLVAAVLLSALAAPPSYIAAQAVPSIAVRHQYENESDFIVAHDTTGSTYVRDGRSGSLSFSSADAGKAINYAIGALGTSGGRIFVKAGTYSVGTRIDIVGLNNVTIHGTSGTVLTPSVAMTMLLIDGDSSHITLRRLTVDGGTLGTIGFNLKTGSDIRIVDCEFRSLQQSAIQGHIHPDYATVLTNIWITGCVISDVQQANLSENEGGIFIYCGQNIFIEDNVVELCGSTGINLSRCTGRATISNNIVSNNDKNMVAGHGHGIYVGSNLPQSSHISIRGNFVTDNGGNGIEAGSGGGSKGSYYVIAENICTGNGATGSGSTSAGIFITGSRHVVSNNICENNGGSGIQIGYADDASNILVEGNTIGNNNAAGNTNGLWSSGISAASAVVSPPSDQRIVIQDNLIYEDSDNAAGGNQLWGIYLKVDADGFVIDHNRVVGHPIGAITWSSTASSMTVRNNVGFRTEARGEIQDSSPVGTSGYLTLDLATLLDVDDVVGTLEKTALSVTPIVGSSGTVYTGASFHHWVEQFSATVFRIHWQSSDTPSEIAFSWLYEPA